MTCYIESLLKNLRVFH